jgi:peptidoglycan-associated lipoprotein
MMRTIPTLFLLLALAAGCASGDRARAALRLSPRGPSIARHEIATGELRQVLLTLRRVHFALDSTTLPAASRQALLEAGTMLANRGDVALGITGHADHRGASEYNLALGQRRAAIVAEVLSAAGVDPFRLALTSHGEERPLVEGTDAIAMARNRRVEFQLTRGAVQLVLDEGDLIDDRGAVILAGR